MKKASCLVFLVCSVLFLQSCKKTANNAINCIGEAFYVNVNFTVDPSNSKTINFTATDSGEYPLKSVQWIYGDINPLNYYSACGRCFYGPNIL